MTDVWYYAEGDKPVGPFGLPELVSALANRPSVESVLVWSKSVGDWRRVDQTPDLREHFIPPPIARQPAAKTVPALQPSARASSPWEAAVSAAPTREAPTSETNTSDVTAAKSGWSVKKFTIGAFSLVVTLIAMAVGGVIGRTGVQAVMSPSTASLQSQLEAAHEKMLPQLRAELPKRVDDQTTMVAVDARGGTVFYSYRVDVNRSDLNFGQFAAELKKSIISAACKEQAYAKSLGYGAKYQYAYSDKNGQALGTILVQRGDC